MTITRQPSLTLPTSGALLRRVVRAQDANAAFDKTTRGLHEEFKRGCDLGRDAGACARWRQ